MSGLFGSMQINVYYNSEPHKSIKKKLIWSDNYFQGSLLILEKNPH